MKFRHIERREYPYQTPFAPRQPPLGGRFGYHQTSTDDAVLALRRLTVLSPEDDELVVDGFPAELLERDLSNPRIRIHEFQLTALPEIRAPEFGDNPIIHLIPIFPNLFREPDSNDPGIENKTFRPELDIGSFQHLQFGLLGKVTAVVALHVS